MRNMLAFMMAMLIVLSTLGWFRNWYAVGTLPAEQGRFAFRLEVDGVKVGSDFADLLHYLQRKFASESKDPADAK